MNKAKPRNSDDDDEEEIDSDDANDVYEYEEAIPEEESGKNRRYDPVENFEYELPEQFQVRLPRLIWNFFEFVWSSRQMIKKGTE